MNLQTVEFDITDPHYRYHSDEVNDKTWVNDKVKLERLARREKLYFFTFRQTLPSPEGTLMFAIGDEYPYEPSLDFHLIFNPNKV